MATPGYSALISGIVTSLRGDGRLAYVPDDSIYYGPEVQVPMFPAITTELTGSIEEWKSFPSQKDSTSTVVIRAFDESLSYTDGLQKVERLAQNISVTLQANRTISGLAYQTNVLSKRFSPGTYDNIPLFGCEIEFEVKQRFAVAQ